MKKRTRFPPNGQHHFPSSRTKSNARSPQRKPFCGAMVGCGLITFASSVSGQAVHLAYAENYAIKSAAGVTNSGFTVVNGNIALSPTPTIIGFSNALPPSGDGYVNVVVHYNNALAMEAQKDARTAYNSLAGLAAGANLTGTDLGGLTLAPGVYNSPAFTVDGPHMDRDRAVLGAGRSVQLSENVNVYASYEGQLGSSNYNSSQVTAGVNIAF